jgi:hypothetical protein
LLLRTETELILESRRVVPARLIEAGFAFGYPESGRSGVRSVPFDGRNCGSSPRDRSSVRARELLFQLVIRRLVTDRNRRG